MIKQRPCFTYSRGAEIDRKVNIYNNLSLNALGTLYELEKDMRKRSVIRKIITRIGTI